VESGFCRQSQAFTRFSAQGVYLFHGVLPLIRIRINSP
jgi:hypothetical protein